MIIGEHEGRWIVAMDREEAASLRHLVLWCSQNTDPEPGGGFDTFLFLSQFIEQLPEKP